MRKSFAVGTLVGATLLGGAGVALADSGEAVEFANGDIVFYTDTAGNHRGQDFPGNGGSDRVCADGPTQDLQEFVTRERLNIVFSPDQTISYLRASYFQGYRCGGFGDTSTSRSYHLDINWARSPSAGPAFNGVTEH